MVLISVAAPNIPIPRDPQFFTAPEDLPKTRSEQWTLIKGIVLDTCRPAPAPDQRARSMVIGTQMDTSYSTTVLVKSFPRTPVEL